MPSSSEAFAYSSGSAASVTPSKLDPRFAVNESLQITEEGEARAFGFSYLDSGNGRQVTEWVFAPNYVPPPAATVTAQTPTDPNRQFTTLSEWQLALKESGPGAIWQTGSTFSASWVQTFRGVPSPSVSFYAPYEEWPTVPVAPSASDAVEQVDPGRAHAPVGPTAVPVGSPTTLTGAGAKTDLCVVTAAGAGHPERGNTLTYTAEFWAMFEEYVQPTTQSLAIQPGPIPGVPAVSLAEFLAYWNGSTAMEAPASLCVVTCSRSRVNPYQE